jgi:hypothetical protein
MDLSMCVVPISTGGDDQSRHCTGMGAITHLA